MEMKEGANGLQKNKAMVIFKENGLLVAIIALFVIMIFSSDVFLTTQNLVNILSRSAAMGIMAVGMTVILITGGLDLSVANVATFSGLLALGLARNQGLSTGMAIFVALLMGVGVGFANGFMITKLKVNSLIATLATMTIIQGFIWVYSNGANIAPAPEVLSAWTEIKVFGIFPLIIFIWIGIGILVALMLKWTKLGRNFYATGGNPEASRLSGIKTDNVRLWAYVIGGFLAAIAGLVLVSRLNAAIPTAAQGMEMTVIAAAVIGGTSLSGGTGKMWGTFLGVILISLVSNAINLWGVPSAYDNVFKGAVIGAAALVDALRLRKK